MAESFDIGVILYWNKCHIPLNVGIIILSMFSYKFFYRVEASYAAYCRFAEVWLLSDSQFWYNGTFVHISKYDIMPR